jgi:hypothetical protein
MRMSVIFMLIGLCGGCARFTEAQMQLVEQAQRGIELCRTAQKDRAAVLAQYYELQRTRLDEASAADVREQKELSPDWVAEHQRAYSAAAAALERQRAASADADSAALKNFDAVDEALRRLLVLQGVQMRLSIDGLMSQAK